MKPGRPAVPRTGRETGEAKARGRSLRVVLTKASPECPDHVLTGHMADIDSLVGVDALLHWSAGALRVAADST
jgi:hypothetical protein